MSRTRGLGTGETHQTSDRTQVREIVEGLGTGLVQVHDCSPTLSDDLLPLKGWARTAEKAEQRGQDQAPDGQTVLGAAPEDGRGLAVAGETVERTRRGV